MPRSVRVAETVTCSSTDAPAIQLDDDRLLLIRHKIDGCRRRRKSVLDHDDFNMTGRQHEHRRAIGASLLDESVDDDIGVANGAIVASDLHPKARGFLRHTDSHIQQHEHSDEQLSHRRISTRTNGHDTVVHCEDTVRAVYRSIRVSAKSAD